jgi:hypothetical protein
MLVFNLSLACEDCTGETTGAISTLGLIGGGKGNDTMGHPWWWETGWWKIYFQPSFAGTSGCKDTCGGMGMPGKV